MSSKLPSDDDKPQADPEASIAVLMITLADTTWRMFVPPALFVFGGIWVDIHYGTKPWMSLLSVALGLAISIALVRRQLTKIK